MSEQNFEWDEEKRQQNIDKHRIDFLAAVEIFDRPTWEQLDARKAYGEDRWRSIGWMKGRIIVVVYTERKDVVRIISARKAVRHEEEEYFRNVRH